MLICCAKLTVTGHEVGCPVPCCGFYDCALLTTCCLTSIPFDRLEALVRGFSTQVGYTGVRCCH